MRIKSSDLQVESISDSKPDISFDSILAKAINSMKQTFGSLIILQFFLLPPTYMYSYNFIDLAYLTKIQTTTSNYGE